MAFKKILVATDFSRESQTALDTAIALARDQGASIQVLHVVDEPVTAAAWSEAYAFDIAGLRQRLLEQAERVLTEIQSAHKEVALSTAAVVGRPAQTIVEIASEGQMDLIVLGSHGHHAISRLLVGSVADHVVRHAPCAVLTVKAPPAAESSAARKAGPIAPA